ncbi:hypothetical protein FRC04_001157 [Tulasnella sp. 424]|nr:hypothetical protein FRC04_001157 [Tulasnella sp. 424]KAG8972750.1 hypothetical protein FRC05_009580 [Tulasnella sp. 425]
MVGSRLHDTRLLENLVKCEKEYQTALANVLGLSHSSVAALAAYGAALSPTNSRAAVGVAQALSDADDALRAYADSIDDWREKLGEIRKLDAEIEVASRDREILITRLIKVSKQKPKGSSNAAATSSSGTKLVIAQSELQACEAHLATKQQELEEMIRSALLDGLEKRCKAMTECGTIWSQKGREGLVALEDLQNTPAANGSTHPYPSYVPRAAYLRTREGNHSIDSSTSLAPSQSASQVGVNHTSPRPSEDTHITTASLGKSLSPIRTSLVMQAAVPSPTHDSYRLDIPPAHSINDHVLPSGTPAATQEGGDELELNSSSGSEDERHIEIHDNPIRAPAHVQNPVVNSEVGKPAVQGVQNVQTPAPEPRTAATGLHHHGTLSKRQPKPPTTVPQQSPDRDSGPEEGPRKRSSSFSLFGSFAGLFSHRSKSSAASGSRGEPPSPTKTRSRMAERDPSPPRNRPQASGSGWQTRTDRNLRENKQEMVVGKGRAAAESSSEDEGAKKKGFFAMKKSDKQAKGKGKEVDGPPPGGLAGGFLMRKKTTTGEPVRRRNRTVDESAALHRLSRHSSDGELHRANSLSKRREPSPRRSRDDADVRRGSSVPPAPQRAPSQPPAATGSTPTSTSKDTSPQTKTGKIRKKAPAKHFDDGLGSSGGSLLKGAAAAAAAATHAPSSPNAATGNTSLGGMGLPSTGGLSRASTVRSANASVAAGARTSSLGRGPGPVNTQTNRRSSLQHDGLMGGGSVPRGMTASPFQESSLSRSDSVGSRASGAGSPAARGRGGGNNLMSIIESPMASRTQSREVSATLETVKAPPSLTSPTAPTLYLPRASAPSPPPPPVPSKAVDKRASLDGAGPSGPRLVLPSELPKAKPGIISSMANGSSTPPFSASLPNIHAPMTNPSGNGGVVSRNSSIRSNGIPSALAPPPLRSALRNRSPSPFAQPGGAQSTPPPVPAKESAQPSPPKVETPKAKPEDDDSASMSSYETGHEDFEESDAPTVQADKPIVQPTPRLASGLFSSVPPPPPPHDSEKNGGTDLSHSTQTDSTGQPSRRKSVRMALPPSVSSTPAATPAARDDEPQWGVPSSSSSRPAPSGIQHKRWHSHAERDIWAEEDSDAEGDYGTARRALERATRHLETAGDLTRQKDKSSHR